MLKGTMEAMTDREHKEMIREEDDAMYYEMGVADPDYCVLKFTAICGRYYSGFRSGDFTVG